MYKSTKGKIIKISMAITLSFILSAAVARFRKIPAPQITVSEYFVSADDTLTIKGTGFIKDFPKANRVFLKKKSSKKKIRLKTLTSSEDSITVSIPEGIKLGDYDLYVFLKTRFFKSKKQKFKNSVKLRPKAPQKPRLKFQVIKDINELTAVVEQDQEHELVLNIEDELQTGKNSLRSFYYEDGYKSLLSEAVEIYYLQEDNFKTKLEISSELPLETYAETLDQNKLEVSELTYKKEQGLTRTYHLKTPFDNSYLATKITLSPIFIKELHAKSPEYIVLSNRDTQDFSLENCHIDDAVTTRHNFEIGTFIQAQSDYTIEGNLSLNDTGDSITMTCGDKVVTEFEYTKLDADGFGI